MTPYPRDDSTPQIPQIYAAAILLAAIAAASTMAFLPPWHLRSGAEWQRPGTIPDVKMGAR